MNIRLQTGLASSVEGCLNAGDIGGLRGGWVA